MFTSKLNTMTGKLDWEIQNEDYDYQQELARAGFADMLHDYERNKLYYAGLKKVIKKLKSENKAVNVLDIGTGTGLLSMMAVNCGADTVTACEAFKPMAQVARKCIERNGMKDKIKIIEKRSTDIIMGVDMVQKANVLVTEVFDTELIGEGAIGTFNHALEHLLIKDCYVIPDNAVMYIQVVESDICHNWNWLNLSQYNLKVPSDFQNLAGDALFDIQLSEFHDFKAITEPLEAFKFSFSGKEPLLFENKNIIEAISKRNGKAHGVFMWWVLRMDYENEILLSCAPHWAHHTPNDMQWRDHWMQAIYFPKNLVKLNQDEKFLIECIHDEYSLWFDVYPFDKKNQLINSSKSSEDISLGITIVSRNRLAQLNNLKRNEMLISLLKKYQCLSKNLLVANDDFSLIPLFAASITNYKTVYVLEQNKFREKCLLSFINENNLHNKIKIINNSFHELDKKNLIDLDFDIIISECSFNCALLPWDNLYFYYGLENLRSILSNDEVFKNKTIMPKRITFNVIAISMENLDKIRSPVDVCEGFDLGEFDKVVLDASKLTDGFMEPHPLWEYPSFPLSNVVEIFNFEFGKMYGLDEPIKKTYNIPLKDNGLLNGIAIWQVIEYDESDPSLKIDTGLLEHPKSNRKLLWNKDYKQAVHILDKKYEITELNRNAMPLNCTVKFEPKLGKFDLDFKIELQ